MEFLKLYIVSMGAFLALDSIWLGVVAPKFYKSQIGHLMAEKPNFFAAGLFYLLFILGLVFFVVQPALKDVSWLVVAARGAFFGIVAYATYDLTSQAVIKDWPWLATAVDLAWGALVSASTAVVALLLYRALFN